MRSERRDDQPAKNSALHGRAPLKQLLQKSRTTCHELDLGLPSSQRVTLVFGDHVLDRYTTGAEWIHDFYSLFKFIEEEQVDWNNVLPRIWT
jgi:hypothetical protein